MGPELQKSQSSPSPKSPAWQQGKQGICGLAVPKGKKMEEVCTAGAREGRSKGRGAGSTQGRGTPKTPGPEAALRSGQNRAEGRRAGGRPGLEWCGGPRSRPPGALLYPAPLQSTTRPPAAGIRLRHSIPARDKSHTRDARSLMHTHDTHVHTKAHAAQESSLTRVCI